MGIKRYRNAIREARANGNYLKCLDRSVTGQEVFLNWNQKKIELDKPVALFRYSQRNRANFREAFATAGNITTNGPLPAYFIKREGQRIDIDGENFDESSELGLIQKTLLAADNIICSDDRKNELIEKYMLKQFFSREGAEVYYVGDLTRPENCFLAEKVIENKKTKVVFAFEGDIKPNVIEFMGFMKEKADFIQIIPDGAVTFMDYVYQYLYKKKGWAKKKTDKYYRREYDRLFKGLNIKAIHFVNTEMFERIGIVLNCRCKRIAHYIPMSFYRKLVDVFCDGSGMREKTFSKFDCQIKYDRNFGAEIWDKCFCNGISTKFDNLRIAIKNNVIAISGGLEIITEDETAEIGKHFLLGSTIHEKKFAYNINKTNEKRNKAGDLTRIRCEISIAFPIDDITEWYNINLPCVELYSSGQCHNVPVLVSKKKEIRGKLVYDIADTGYALEIRRDYRHLRFVIKQASVTDRKCEKLKLGIAFICSLLTFWNKSIVLYEKYCSKYEESASILFEQLVDAGYKNVRFILNKECLAAESVPEKYKRYIINQFSFQHYYNLFACKSIFSSEALGHALEKGTASELFKSFVLDGSKNYVFLQHGVMYMIALSSEQRNFFRKGKGKGKKRVVVSSELEAAHFIENTNYEREDIYNCGLIKFDRSFLEDNADKIMVMLTWRPWEFVTGLADMKNTGYYRMLKKIVDAVPDDLKERLIVMPHPLISDQINLEADDDVWKYYVPDQRYEDILRMTKLLITDYSSISYDAFFRGSNVIFNWEEKEQCMKEYGENGHLMLTEQLAFGPVCKSNNMLTKAIEETYNTGQKEDYINNYRKIVEHYDRHNVDRFINMARKDGLLK